jgi:sugar phosphate isomerase/epimerase
MCHGNRASTFGLNRFASSRQLFARSPVAAISHTRMKLKVYRNLWGYSSPSDAAVSALIEAGYDGIEALLVTRAEHAEMKRIRRKRQFPFKGTVWTRGAGPSASDHLLSFKKQLTALIRTGADSINVMGGYDCWSADESALYFEGALEFGAKMGVPISHEIHRNTALFHPTAAKRILKRFPELRLTCDFSHWVVACERLIDDQIELVRLCGTRADHIHVRVGTEESPQVPDVRTPGALPYLKAFERWWDIVWEEQLARGATVSTLCPEFGPPPYQATQPYSGAPVAELAAICDWQKDRQVARFNSWIASRKRR